jgi:MFS family permease
MVVAGFLPVFAIIAMFPVVAAMIDHFRPTVPDAAQRVPQMVTAPGYAIAALAPFAGFSLTVSGGGPSCWDARFSMPWWARRRFSWKALMASASRILLGVCEAGILTVVNTLIADYWQDSGRRNWLMLQGLIGPFFQSVVFIAVAQVAAWRWNGGFLSIWRRCRSSFRCVSPSSNPAGPIRRPWPRPLCCSMRARRRFAGAAAVVGPRCSPLCSITCSS